MSGHGEGENKLRVIVASESLRSLTERRAREIEIDPQQLSVNLNLFLTQMNDVLRETPEKIGKFKLKEFELSIEISAEGQVVLWGVGGTVGGAGGITLKFSRDT
jgi:hypothetical protein